MLPLPGTCSREPMDSPPPLTRATQDSDTCVPIDSDQHELQARVKPNVSPKTLESSVVRSTTPDDGEVPAPWPTAMASCCAVL